MTITEHPNEYRNEPWSDARSAADEAELGEAAKPARRPLAISLAAAVLLLGLVAVGALVAGGWMVGRSGTNRPGPEPVC